MSVIRAYLKGLVEEAKRPAEGVNLSLSELRPRAQPRRRFEDASLKALAESIRAHGVLEPLLVRKAEEGYEIIAGERRYRAAQMVGLAEVPAIVLEVDNRTAQAIALMENLQREDLNPYEETLGILDLVALELGKGREEVVSLLHRMRNEIKGRATRNVTGSPEVERVERIFRLLGRMSWESFVRNRLPLLNLPSDLQEALLGGSIPYTVAVELKKVKDSSLRLPLLEEAKVGLSLRDLKTKVRKLLKKESLPSDPYRDVLRRLTRLDLETLPPEQRKKVEAYLDALVESLGW